MLSRNSVIRSRELLLNPSELDAALYQRRWAELADVLEYVRRAQYHNLALTDPFIYRKIMQGVTEFYIQGYGEMNLQKLREAAREQAMNESP